MKKRPSPFNLNLSIQDITFDWSNRYVCNGNKCWCHNGYLRRGRHVHWWWRHHSNFIFGLCSDFCSFLSMWTRTYSNVHRFRTFWWSFEVFISVRFELDLDKFWYETGPYHTDHTICLDFIWIKYHKIWLTNGVFRPNAVAIAALVNWLTNALIGFTYPILDDIIGGYTFFIFGGFCFISCIYTFFYVPETKGKEISEIQKMFMSNPPSGWFSNWEF